MERLIAARAFLRVPYSALVSQSHAHGSIVAGMTPTAKEKNRAVGGRQQGGGGWVWYCFVGQAASLVHSVLCAETRDWQKDNPQSAIANPQSDHSHSMVAGGLLETS